MSAASFEYKPLRQKLLAWYDRHARDLPWRRTQDPYAIWVSEIMLQQTRVDTVIPYYERFMERFPSLSHLAEASEDEVLTLWSGLGYYRRARLLHRGVREVVASYGAEVPEAAEERLRLPGVGRYTAGAIGSIAFDREEPVVDGNVFRVLTRFLRIHTPLGDRETERRCWDFASELVRGKRPGDLNQALMELGSQICTPSAPDCSQCPLKKRCAALASGETQLLPYPKPKKTPQTLRLVSLVATLKRGDETKVWLSRSSQPLFGGLWGIPFSELRSQRQAAAKAKQLLKDIGVRPSGPLKKKAQVEHILTHRRLQTTVYCVEALSKRALKDQRYVALSDLDSLGTSKFTRKVLEAAFN